nr:coiled-coil domain-containing protein 9-like [Penaeus vannamei]
MACGSSSQLSSLLLTAQSSSTTPHPEDDLFQMSREEKEKLLNQRMESMRRKNEELRKRHEEIEADKQNADKFSSTVTMEEVKPYVMKAPRVRPERAERQRDPADPPPPRPADVMPARQRLSENDGPPPDPSYRFLSDPDRDGSEQTRENRKEHRGRGGRGRASGARGRLRGRRGRQPPGRRLRRGESPENGAVPMGQGSFRGRGAG